MASSCSRVNFTLSAVTLVILSIGLSSAGTARRGDFARAAASWAQRRSPLRHNDVMPSSFSVYQYLLSHRAGDEDDVALGDGLRMGADDVAPGDGLRKRSDPLDIGLRMGADDVALGNGLRKRSNPLDMGFKSVRHSAVTQEECRRICDYCRAMSIRYAALCNANRRCEPSSKSFIVCSVFYSVKGGR